MASTHHEPWPGGVFELVQKLLVVWLQVEAPWPSRQSALDPPPPPPSFP
jgi:hypothetical protein